MGREIVEISLADWDNRKHEIAKQLHDAAKNVGFFYIAGKGFNVHSPAYEK